MIKRAASTAALTTLILLNAASASAWEKIAPCVFYEEVRPFVHAVKADLTCKNIELVGTAEQDKGTTTTQFAEREHTIVAVNANYFRRSFEARGLVITDGRPWNRAKDGNEWFYFACTRTNRCEVEEQERAASINPDWNIAVSGWQLFFHENFHCASSAHANCVTDNANKRHPRTMIGLDYAGTTLYFVVIEGRLKTFAGMTLDEAGEVFRKLGVIKGLNLDGGGSSSMIINGQRVNRLPENQLLERPVTNHFGIRVR